MGKHRTILIGSPSSREELHQFGKQVKATAKQLRNLDEHCPGCEQCQQEEPNAKEE